MQISPRYDGDPIIQLDGSVDDVKGALLRQRRRLVATVERLDDEQWNAPSRCDEWRVQDVIAHLVATDRFWAASLQMGLAGEPSRMLEGFDPKASPAGLVDAVRDQPPAETRRRFTEATHAFLDAVEALDDAGWSVTAEAPPGHISVRAMAHHALWDCWVHERDVALPLGLPVAEERDEVLAGLRYAAALSPAFAVVNHPGRTGVLALSTSDPDATIIADVGTTVRVHDGPIPAEAIVVEGPAVEILEALSVRGPFPSPVTGEQAWLLSGLTEVFETDPAPA